MDIIELISHTDDYLKLLVESNLKITYLLLFLIIFAESGLIIFPFLPGDGLLFSVGVISAITPLNLYLIIPLLILAAILGYSTNYKLGVYFGEWLLNKNYSFVKKPYKKTSTFLKKNGKRALILSRFFPVVRTYIPFVAGVVRMNYPTFLLQNIVGGVSWITSLVLAGYFLGEIQWVKDHYGHIFLGLIIFTLLPLILELMRSFRKSSY